MFTIGVVSRKAQHDKVLTEAITTAFLQNRAVYGTRRLKKVLEKQGENVSRRRIGRIMQEAGQWLHLGNKISFGMGQYQLQ